MPNIELNTKVYELNVIGKKGLHAVKVLKILDHTAVVELISSAAEMGLVFLTEFESNKQVTKRNRRHTRPFSFR